MSLLFACLNFGGVNKLKGKIVGGRPRQIEVARLEESLAIKGAFEFELLLLNLAEPKIFRMSQTPSQAAPAMQSATQPGAA